MSSRVSGFTARILDRFGLAGIGTCLAVWSAIFIRNSSVVVDKERYFILFDDAMISMTYARNLVEGHGLNWARWGEPVEGFTCPLWTLIMVPFNAVPVDLAWRSLGVQILSLVILLANLAVLKLLTVRFFRSGEQRSWLPAVVLTAAFYPLVHWTLMGMETGLQALIITAASYLTLDVIHGRHDRRMLLATVLSLGMLLRPDMALLAFASFAVGFVGTGGSLWQRLRSWWPAWAMVVAVVAGYQVFRLAYFGDPLPNTYYLKLTGVPLDVRILRGALVFLDFVRPWWWLGAAVLAGTFVKARSSPAYRLLALIVVLHCAYSIYVGGDAWEDGHVKANRWVSPVLPLFFVLATGLLNEVMARWSKPARSWPGGMLRALPALALIVVTTLQVQHLSPRSLDDPSWDGLMLRLNPIYRSHQTSIGDLQHIGALVDDDGVLAAIWAGIPAYFTDYRMVDMLGYNDRVIARQDLAVEFGRANARDYVPGHFKYDLEYVLTEQRPDVIYRRWGLSHGKFRQLLRRHGYAEVNPRIWLRIGSPHLIERSASSGGSS